ncbi:hypothetical protein P4Q63_005615 [Salmonella enterica]|nr:hypothetical protein [Salmonella enterica]
MSVHALLVAGKTGYRQYRSEINVRRTICRGCYLRRQNKYRTDCQRERIMRIIPGNGQRDIARDINGNMQRNHAIFDINSSGIC